MRRRAPDTWRKRTPSSARVPDRPLRVAFLSSARTWRGSAVSNAQIARGIAAAGGHAQFFTSARDLTLRAAAEDIPCTELAVGSLSLRGVQVLRRAVWDHAIDALVVDKRRDLLHGALAVRGLPVALVSRFMYPAWAAPTDPVTRLAYRRVDVTAFLSENAVPYVARHARFMLRPRHVAIHEGIDTGRFRPDPAARITFRGAQQLGERPLILGVGALEAEKRYDGLIDAVARLPQPRPAVLIIGEGSRRGALAAAAAARGVDLRLPGTVPHETLAAAYAAATVFVHPSTMEAFGIAVAEAMACGCPVIVADAGSLPEVVGDAGVVVPPDDPAALADALRDLLSDQARRDALGGRGRTQVLERFTLARMQAAHLAALTAAVALRRR